MSAPLPGEQFLVNVALSYNSDGTVNIAFEGIAPEDIDALLASVGTAEFKQTMITSLNDSVKERRERGEL